MLFNSTIFLIFLAVVLLLYRGLRDYRQQNAMLLVASYVFYGTWNWRFLSLVIASTLIDFILAQKIDASSVPSRRRLYLLISLTFSLGFLGFFKYYNFGIESFAHLLNYFGIKAHLPTLRVILPVGISFYTFQTMGYIIDVYRGQTKAVKNLLTFALFVAFFPQLVAGPIERAGHLVPQLQRPRAVTVEDYRVGIMWILLGYLKKVIFADTLAPLVDYVFANPTRVSGATSFVGLWGFAIQIYGDFAGYSLIARGVARLLGIELVTNFVRPYLARNPREFWSRWHVSLSFWMRDYLYVGLGGNRKGRARTQVNLMITMLLAGLWHGARWNFVLWGVYWGMLVMASHMLGLGRKGTPANRMVIIAQVGITFLLTLGGWLFFRTTSIEHLKAVGGNILGNLHWGAETVFYLKPTLTVFALLMAYHVWQERAGDDLMLLRLNAWIRLGIYVFILVTIFTYRSQQLPFIYFQF